jgi:hypothetical protein
MHGAITGHLHIQPFHNNTTHNNTNMEAVQIS